MTTESRLRALEARFNDEVRRLKASVDNLRAVGSVPRYRNDADMGSNRITNVSDAVADTDAVNKRTHDDVKGRSFICTQHEARLPAERKWVDGTGIDSVDGGPNGDFTVSVDVTELTLPSPGDEAFALFIS